MKPRSERGWLYRIWSLVYPMLIYEGVALLVSMIVLAAVFLIHRAEFLPLISAGTEEALSEMTSKLNDYYLAQYLWISFGTCLASIPIFWFLIRRDREEDLREGAVKRYEKAGPLPYALTFLAGITMALALNNLLIYSRLTEIFAEGYDEVADLIYSGNVWLEVLTTALLVPVVEEMIFRGLIYRRLRVMAGVTPAIIASAILFGLYHMNVLQAIYASLLGLVLAFACERFHSIVAPILIHMGANLFSVLATETGLFDFVYETEAAFLIATGAALAVFAGLAFWLITRVDLQPLEEEPAVQETEVLPPPQGAERS